MDWQPIAIGALSLTSALLGAILSRVWDATQKLTTDLNALAKEVSGNYVRRDDFWHFKDELMGSLNRIESKIDGKADKK